MKRCLFSLLAVSLLVSARGAAGAEFEPIARVLPPEGLEIPDAVRERLEKRLAETKRRFASQPDVEIFTKAVELALAHREFYVERDFAKADWALDQASQRLDALAKGEAPWKTATGLVVRGYKSNIDDSVQPYGLVIPEGHDFTKPCPLYVWLHGRGDKNTDLHFLQERSTRPGQIAPPGGIVVHPFGRHCVGWKHAGEIDVLETVIHLQREKQYNIDSSRRVLIGFSMGGAGAWHIGAHYVSVWNAVAPGAGFAETARYQRLTPDRFPPSYEQTLWGLYDVPGYVRNLFNTQTIAYSGELDRQIQAARVMEEAYRSEGRELTHLIGPGVEHKYEPQTLKDLMTRLEAAASQPKQRPAKQVHLQTRTLRYPQVDWVTVLRLEEHWKDTRVDAEIVGEKSYRLTTKNVAALQLGRAVNTDIATVDIDGTRVYVGSKTGAILVKRNGTWEFLSAYHLDRTQAAKGPELTGPIDDAFMDRFLVVVPSGQSKNARFQAWMDFELAHFTGRWKALMRGEPRVMRDVDVTDLDLHADQNLILWGDPDSNTVMARLIGATPVSFARQKWKLGDREFDGDQFVPVAIYPRKDAKGEYRRYIVLNSGLTFREGHDRTNSLQNPKLPDWAIVDLAQPPDAFAPGRIHDAGFFDEQWQLRASR